MRDLHDLPADLPIPVDDGAADHLSDATLPDLTLACTSGWPVLLRGLVAPTVLFFYPRTGVPGQHVGEASTGKRGTTFRVREDARPRAAPFATSMWSSGNSA